MNYDPYLHEEQLEHFDHKWKNYLKHLPPLDKMTSDEAEKFKPLVKWVYWEAKQERR